MSVTYTSTTDEAAFKAVINKLTKLKPSLIKQLGIDIDKSGDELVKIMQGNAHVITGTMKGSISKKKKGPSSVSVGPTVDYAVYENARGGDHAFIDNSLQDFKPKFVTIVRKGVQTVLKKKTL